MWFAIGSAAPRPWQRPGSPSPNLMAGRGGGYRISRAPGLPHCWTPSLRLAKAGRGIRRGGESSGGLARATLLRCSTGSSVLQHLSSRDANLLADGECMFALE